jgi:hypothetical protein
LPRPHYSTFERNRPKVSSARELTKKRDLAERTKSYNSVSSDSELAGTRVATRPPVSPTGDDSAGKPDEMGIV